MQAEKHVSPPAYSAASPLQANPSSDSKSPSGSKETQIIQETVEALSDDLRRFSLKMHGYAEVAMKEYKTHDLMADFMEDQGPPPPPLSAFSS